MRTRQNCQLCGKRYQSKRTEGIIVCGDCRKIHNWLDKVRIANYIKE